MSIILIVIGGILTCLSWWLLFHLSDEKIHRLIYPRGIAPMSKESSEAYQEINLALIAIVVMIMGTMLLIGGIAKLMGWL
ncbi:MAG TPA: hypothetical protein VF658_02955 [Pyrinomonadaceae bacterium]|jgi:hypothetical protein